MVLFEFLTSCCRAWLPIYFLSFIDQFRIIIKEISITISSPWNATAHAIWRSPSSLAIHSANPSYESSKSIYPKRIATSILFTFVKTAMEANELPKLIPTTGGSVKTTGASALPFGTAFVVIAKDIELRRWLIPKEKEKEKIRRCTCQCALRSHVFTLIYQAGIALVLSETPPMTCNHLGQLTRLSQPKLSQSVHREECTQCFDDQVRPLCISKIEIWASIPAFLSGQSFRRRSVLELL